MLRAHVTASSLRHLAAIALGLTALGAPSLALADDAQVESGFALQANLAAKTSLVTFTGGGNNLPSASLPGNGLDTQLFAGYKAGRLLIGVGLEFQNGTVNSSTTVGNVTTSASTSASLFLIGPEVQFAMVRSGDGRVELIGDLALHFGHAVPDASDTSSNFLLSYQIGPGVRFWAHKHFAITGLTGFSGELYHFIPDSNAPAGTSTNLDISTHGIFGSFGMLGVF